MGWAPRGQMARGSQKFSSQRSRQHTSGRGNVNTERITRYRSYEGFPIMVYYVICEPIISGSGIIHIGLRHSLLACYAVHETHRRQTLIWGEAVAKLYSRSFTSTKKHKKERVF